MGNTASADNFNGVRKDDRFGGSRNQNACTAFDLLECIGGRSEAQQWECSCGERPPTRDKFCWKCGNRRPDIAVRVVDMPVQRLGPNGRQRLQPQIRRSPSGRQFRESTEPISPTHNQMRPVESQRSRSVSAPMTMVPQPSIQVPATQAKEQHSLTTTDDDIFAASEVTSSSITEPSKKSAYLTSQGKSVPQIVDQAKADLDEPFAGAHKQEQACILLAAVTRTADGRELVTQRIGVAPIVAAMARYPRSEQLQREGCIVLLELMNGREDLQEEVAQVGGAEAALRALRIHISSGRIVRDSTLVLQRLCMTQIGRRRIAERGGINEFSRLLRERSTSAAMAEVACSALGNLAFDEELRSQVNRDSIVAILQAMRMHPRDEGLQDGGAFVLHNLAFDEAHIQTIKSLGGLEVIEQAVANFPPKDGEADERIATLDLLKSSRGIR